MGKFWMVALLLFTVIQDCVKDPNGPEEDVPSEVVGTWYASEYLLVNTANTSQTEEMISSGGSFTLTINTDGSFSVSVTYPGEAPEAISGTLTFNGSQVTADDGEDQIVFTWLVHDSVLTLTNPIEQHDFNDDGIDETALLTIVLTQSPDANPNPTVPAELIGTWNASSVTHTNNANSSQSVELISQGKTFTLVIRGDGTFTATDTDPGMSPVVNNGTMVFNGNQVTIDDGEGVFTATWFLSQGSLSVVFDDDYDFEGDGVDESVTTTITLTKQ